MGGGGRTPPPPPLPTGMITHDAGVDEADDLVTDPHLLKTLWKSKTSADFMSHLARESTCR